MIYTLIHGRDPIPCRPTYIEYRSPVNILIIFLRITTQFHWFSLQKSFFSIVLRHQSWGVPFGEPEKFIFLIQYNIKRNVISGWPVFLLKRCSLGTSDIQGCYLTKGITYMIYTLIHERDPIPCRTTYIEYRSPVNIFINFLRITTQFHWFSLQKSFFFIVLRHQSWGYPSVSLKRSFFKYNIKRNWSFRGARFSFEMF